MIYKKILFLACQLILINSMDEGKQNFLNDELKCGIEGNHESAAEEALKKGARG